MLERNIDRGAARVLAACCALLANAGSAAASEVPPRLHVVRVNESTPQALAGVRTIAALEVETCRALLHMGAAGEPDLPEAQLAKIVFYQDETFFDGDRIAHYTTRRYVVADSGSSCQPYVQVVREAKVIDGCETEIFGRSGNDLNSVAPLDPPPWAPDTRVEKNTRSAEACMRKRKPLSTAGVAADSAGLGVACVWHSRLMEANYGALMKSKAGSAGAGPAATGLDACLYQQLPHYASPHSAGEDVVLRTHAFDPLAERRSVQMTVGGGRLEFEGNTRLQTFESGSPAAAKFDKGAVDAFVRLPPKEGV